MFKVQFSRELFAFLVHCVAVGCSPYILFAFFCRSPLSDGTSRIRNWLHATPRGSFSFGLSMKGDGLSNLSMIEAPP